MNGTLTSKVGLGWINQSFVADTTYKITITHLSGSFSQTGNATFAAELVDSSNALLSERQYISPSFPSLENSHSGQITITSTSASQASKFYLNIWEDTSNGLVFNNYKVKVGLTKVESKSVTSNSTYGTLPTPNPTRIGYTFDGWYTAISGGTEVTASSTVTENDNHTLYAHWTPKTATITFKSNYDGGPADVVKTYTYGVANQAFTSTGFNGGSDIYTRTGYTGSGWSESSTATSATYYWKNGISNNWINGATTRTLYAVWQINSYALTVKPNSGSYNGTTNDTTATQNYNTYYGLNTPARTGHTFNGWLLSGSGSLLRGNNSGKATTVDRFTETSKIDADGTSYTNYKYTITNSSTTSSTWPSLKWPTYSFTVGHTYRISVDVRLNTYSNLGYVELRHAAWSNDYNSTGRIFIGISADKAGLGWINYSMDRAYSATTINSTTVNPLFEIYTAIYANTTGSIDFDIKNIVIEDITNSTQISSSTYGGYVYRYENGAGTVTAQWSTNTYYLTYNKNTTDTVSSMPSSSTTYTYAPSGSVNLASNTPTRTGYTFLGWSTSSSATSASYAAGATWARNNVPNSGTTYTLYAVWSIKSITCSGGNYLPASSDTCTQCPANSYCGGGTWTYDGNQKGRSLCSSLASGSYTTSPAGSDASNDCYIPKANLSKKYVATANAEPVACTAGYFCAGSTNVKYGSTGGRTQCATGSYSAASSSTCTACSAGKTTSGVATSSSSCTACSNSSNVSTWSSQSWSNNTVSNLCKAATCATGYTVSGNNCVAKKIKLTLNKNGGSGGTDYVWYYYGTSKFYSNEACTTEITSITRPTRSNYNFVHYYGDGTSGGNNGERYIAYDNVEFASDLATDIYQDATLYAKWEGKIVVTFNANGGSVSPSSKNVAYGDTYGTLPTPTKSGKTFTGWEITSRSWISNSSALRQPAYDVGVRCSSSNGNCWDGDNDDSDSRGWSYSNANWQFTLPAGKYRVILNFYEKITTNRDYCGLSIYRSSGSAILNARNELYNVSYYETTFTLSSSTSLGVMIKGYDGLYRAEIYKVNDITSSTTVSTNANHTVTAHWS